MTLKKLGSEVSPFESVLCRAMKEHHEDGFQSNMELMLHLDGDIQHPIL